MKKKFVWIIVFVMLFSLLPVSNSEAATNIGITKEEDISLSPYNIKTYSGGMVELSGTVIKSSFEDVQFGNIFENECTLLQLDQPINIRIKSYNGFITINNYKSIQICYVGRTPYHAMAWVGKHVTVRGELTESPSGHYYAGVLLNIDDIRLSEKPSGNSSITNSVVPAKTRLLSVVRKNKRKMKVRWKKIKGVTGYIIQYSTKSNFKNSHIKVVSGSENSSKIIKNLKRNKKYYFKICTYINQNGKQYKSDWSNVIKVKKKNRVYR